MKAQNAKARQARELEKNSAAARFSGTTATTPAASIRRTGLSSSQNLRLTVAGGDVLTVAGGDEISSGCGVCEINGCEVEDRLTKVPCCGKMVCKNCVDDQNDDNCRPCVRNSSRNSDTNEGIATSDGFSHSFSPPGLLYAQGKKGGSESGSEEEVKSGDASFTSSDSDDDDSGDEDGNFLSLTDLSRKRKAAQSKVRTALADLKKARQEYDDAKAAKAAREAAAKVAREAEAAAEAYREAQANRKAQATPAPDTSTNSGPNSSSGSGSCIYASTLDGSGITSTPSQVTGTSNEIALNDLQKWLFDIVKIKKDAGIKAKLMYDNDGVCAEAISYVITKRPDWLRSVIGLTDYEIYQMTKALGNIPN